jgi:hypothetical protein
VEARDQLINPINPQGMLQHVRAEKKRSVDRNRRKRARRKKEVLTTMLQQICCNTKKRRKRMTAAMCFVIVATNVYLAQTLVRPASMTFCDKFPVSFKHTMTFLPKRHNAFE